MTSGVLAAMSISKGVAAATLVSPSPAERAEAGRVEAVADPGRPPARSRRALSEPEVLLHASRRAPNGAPATGTGEREWRPVTRVFSAVVRSFIRLVTDTHFEGVEHLPDGPCILATNHLSMWDAPVLLQRMERRTVILLVEELRSYPWIHWTMHKIWDAIYVKRGEADTEALAQALEVLRGGGRIGIAPEGIRTPALQRGLTGVAYLALRSGTPVVPIALWGQQRVPANLLRFTRTRVHVRIGRPIAPPTGDLTGAAMRAYTDGVMTALARLLPQEYRGVYGGDAVAQESVAAETA